MVLTVTMNPAVDREIYLEDFQVNKLHRIRDYTKTRMSPGGKGINVSIALSRLGIPSIAMGFVGGHMGRILLEELRRTSHLITTNFVHVDGETRENIEIIDEKRHTITEINFPGPEIKKSDLEAFLRRYRTVLARANCVVISGSLPLGVNEEVCAELVRMAKESGATVFVELVPSIVEKMLLAGYAPDVVKLDLRESGQTFFSRKLETFEVHVEIAEEIASKSKLAILSYEVKNDIVALDGEVWMITAREEIDLSHTLGAGDAYVAGMVYYFLKHGLKPLEMAKYGFAAALASTRMKEKTWPTLEAIERELSFFDLERVK